MERKKVAIQNKETRTYRASMNVEPDGKTVTGYAAVFNALSEEMWGFRERIDPAAFDSADMSDTRALFNHDPNMLLARTSSGTLKLEVDDKGLRYSFELPDTTAGRDLGELLRRGDVTQSSFGFTISDDEWEERKNDDGEVEEVTRVIKKVKRLYDVSPVTYPAYPDTSVALRSLEAWKEEHKEENTETQKTPLRDRAEALIF